MNLLNLIEDQTSGYENLRALMHAVNASSDAQLNLNGEPVTLTYPEARFMIGKYKAYNKAGRQAEFIRDLGDARQFDLHMKQLRDLIQKQKDFRGSVPGERGVAGDLAEISQPVPKKDPLSVGMLNWQRMLQAFDGNRPTVELEFDGGQPLTVYRPQMQALFLKAKKMTNQQQQELVQKLSDRFETIEYIDYLRRKGMIPTKPAYNKPETDPGQMDLPFEAKKKESDELNRDTAINPKVQRAFQIARARNPGAGSDIEAFIRDEMQRTAEIEQELQNVQADNQDQEQQIKKLSAAVAQMAKVKPAPAPIAVAPTSKAAPEPTPKAEPVAAEPKKEPAKPEVQPQRIPEPIQQRQPTPKAEPTPKVEPDTKVQTPKPDVTPEVPDNVIQFPGLSLPGTDVGEPEQRKKRRRAAESVEIIAGEFQGRCATIVESKRNFVTVDIEGFGRHVIHESRVAETQVDINRFDTDRPILPSGAAKLKYAADHNMYDDARIQESLRPGEYHVATVTLDNGDVRKFKVTFDEGYTDVIKNFYAKQGRTVKNIDMDWSVQGDFYEQGVAEGAVKDLYTELAEKYRELAPKIERHRDSYLAGELYDALEEIAARHGAMAEFRKMMNGARNRAHMDYDTNPGGFQNWFWYLPFADEQLDEKQDACYHKVKSRYKVWPSAYASGALVQCRKKGAANWGNKGKKE